MDAVGLIDKLPLTIGTETIAFNVDGHEPPQGQEEFLSDRAVVDAGFFSAAGVPVMRGRRFTGTERSDGQRVAIISEAMARRFWPDGDAVGRLVRRPGMDDADLRVVGVAADIKVRSLGEAPRFMVYQPYAQVSRTRFRVVARTSANPEQTALALLTAGRAEDDELWVEATTTMARHLSTARVGPELLALLVSAFGVLALVLAGIGLYGVVNYAVATRTREVGIRMALGAGAPAIARLLAGSGVRLVLLGSGIGLTISLLLTRLLSSLLFGVQPFDPITLVGAPLVLVATAVLAAYFPARRASPSRADPVTALRAE